MAGRCRGFVLQAIALTRHRGTAAAVTGEFAVAFLLRCEETAVRCRSSPENAGAG